MKFLLPLVVFGVVAGLLITGIGREPAPVPSPLVDEPVPSIRLPPLREGAEGLDTGRLREGGAVSLLNVWASWCAPCQQEHPVFLDIADAVPVYGINYKDTRADALDWLDRLGDPYRAVGFDAEGRLSIDLGVYGVPETYVIGPDGRVRYKHVGPVTPEVYEDKLRPLIARLRAEAAP